RIEVENQGAVDDNIVAYDVSVEEWKSCPADLGRFHACCRRENPTEPERHYTVLDIKGRGHFIGCGLAVQGLESTLSYLEGFPFVHVDGETEPSLKYWGTEDFFGGSYYFERGAFAGPYSGATVVNKSQGRFAGYRLLIKDAIPFQTGIKVQLAHGHPLKSGKMMSYSGRADYASVAFWYQTEPHDPSGYQGMNEAERTLSPIPQPAPKTK
ncbi:MAG: glycoside hydrolase family 172 protein, partial [Verrucomicrobiaceae bacterium]